jgi:hypothetical protein
MTPENFVYWLQGHLEINEASPYGNEGLTREQVKVVKQHLDLVLSKVTVSIPYSNPVEPYPPTDLIPYWQPPISICGSAPYDLTTTHTGSSAKLIC